MFVAEVCPFHARVIWLAQDDGVIHASWRFESLPMKSPYFVGIPKQSRS